jgi:hypothetical protein
MVVEPAVDDFLCGLDDHRAELGVELAQRDIGFGRGALDDAQCLDDRLGLLFPADLEVAKAPFRLRTPLGRLIHLDGAKSIGLDALRHDRLSRVGLDAALANTRRHGLQPRHKSGSCRRASLSGRSNAFKGREFL